MPASHSARLWSLFLAALLGWPGTLDSAHLPVRIYTTADGLPRERVNCIVPDSHGFLWLCTAEGLSRFDGYQFTNYGVAQGLAHRTVNAFLETREGIYLAATEHGVSRLDPNAAPGSAAKFVSLPSSDGRPTQGVSVMLQDRVGTVWCATNAGLYRIENLSGSAGVLRFVDLGIGIVNVLSLAEDRYGTLWAGTGAGLRRLWADGHVDQFTTRDGLSHNQVNTLLHDREGNLWAGTLDGLCRIRVKQGEMGVRLDRVYGVSAGLASGRIHSLLQSSAGKVWVGTALGLGEFMPAGGASGTTVERFQNYIARQGLSGATVSALNEDRDGNLWVGDAKGLIRIARNGFSEYTAAEGIGGLSVTNVFEDAVGVLFAVTNQASTVGIHEFDGQQFISTRPKYPPAMRYFGWGWNQSALQDHTGEWWIATGEGLCRFPRVASTRQLAHTPPKAVYTTKDGMGGNDVFRVFEDARRDIWISTSSLFSSLSRWDRATGSIHPYSAGDCPGLPTAFAEDRHGNLWIGFSNDANRRQPTGLLRYRNGRLQKFQNSDGVPAGWIHALFVDRSGRLWVGSADGGLSRVDDPAAERLQFVTYTTAQGLSSMTIRCITEDQWGRIYVGTGRGVDRLDPETGRFRHYSTADGLPGGTLHAAYRDRQGTVWFATSQGLGQLVPQPDRPGSGPPVYITGVRVMGEERPVPDPGLEQISGFLLRPNQNQLQIDFVSPALASDEPLRYQYRLEGADAAWSGPLIDRTVNYASLSPGKYRFLVRALTAAGLHSVNPAELTFEILPPVWRRWWFLVCAAAMITLLAYAGHGYHLRRQLELERVRTRIATDLHDDLGASLSRVAILSEVVNRQATLGHSESGRRLAEIAETARGLVDSMGDIVWAIDPRRDDMQSLIRRIRQFASDVLESQDIRWTFDAAPELEKLRLSPEQRRHLFLIFKEGVNNAARHAACASVGLSIEVRGNQCIAVIRDDGCGLREDPEGSGNGLRNIRARVEALAGRLDIVSRPGAGTEFLVQFPLGGFRHRGMA